MLKNIDGSGGGGKAPGAELWASTCLVEHLHPRVAQKHKSLFHKLLSDGQITVVAETKFKIS